MAENLDLAWKPWSTGSDDATDKPLAWHRSRVPYLDDSHELQNVDIWVSSIKGSFLKETGPWIIYIHGGAWRDPLVDSSSFNETVNHLLSGKPNILDKIGGVASINYSLSPHPTHPTHPAPVPGDGNSAIRNRSAKHPEHIVDVLRAIKFLDSQFGFGSHYVLVGHSCGATLALQVAMDRSQWKTTTSTQSSEMESIPKPIAIIGLNGLYDLPSLIADPGSKHQQLRGLYEGFTRLAFGDDKDVWAAISPTSVQNWSEVWPEGKQVVLVQSHEDTLVPYSQTELIFKTLRASGAHIQISEMEATGDHNELWKAGDRLAEILKRVLTSLS